MDLFGNKVEQNAHKEDLYIVACSLAGKRTPLLIDLLHNCVYLGRKNLHSSKVKAVSCPTFFPLLFQKVVTY